MQTESLSCTGSVLGTQWGPHTIPTNLASPNPWVSSHTHSQNPKETVFASPKTPKKLDFCRHPLLRNRRVIPGMVPECVSPTGQTCLRSPGRKQSHGEHQDSHSHLWCCIPSLFSGKPAYINNSKSGEGRAVHFLITCETTAAPKEQRDGRG